MASSPLLSPNLSPTFTSKPTTYQPSKLLFKPLQPNRLKREFPVALVAAPIPYQSMSVDYLEEEFSGHGVKFEEVGGSCVAKMTMENGTTASLMLPNALITSYKPQMWHGSTMELLHTIVSEGDDGSPAVQGGVSLAFSCSSDGGEFWSPGNWSLRDIRGHPEESIQVELISTETKDMVEIKNIVTLHETCISSEIVVSNFKTTPLQVTGCLVSHLTVSTTEATYVVGLEGSDFFDRSPFQSDYGIILPDEHSQDNMFNIIQRWSRMSSTNGDGSKEGLDEGEETDNYKQLTDQMSKIYTCAPSTLTIIDRGRRNSVISGRYGFNELYMFSPGCGNEFYSRYSYICIGPSAMLKPIVLKPGEVWRGGQHLQNPNL